MATCGLCKKKYDPAEAEAEFEAYDEFDGELSYADEGEGLCGDCAINEALSNLSAGAQYMYSLETGHPPEDMPQEWTPERD